MHLSPERALAVGRAPGRPEWSVASEARRDRRAPRCERRPQGAVSKRRAAAASGAGRYGDKRRMCLRAPTQQKRDLVLKSIEIERNRVLNTQRESRTAAIQKQPTVVVKTTLGVGAVELTRAWL
jgi:hypothetical protein